jgi:prefoldin subunit 5
MRAALNAALAGLDAREKACHPPTGGDQFTDPPRVAVGSDGGSVPVELASCKMLNENLDPELIALRARAAAIPAEIQAVQTSIDNINKRISPLRRDLAEVGTWIPPEATKTQYEGALNALRAERKVSIESSLEFYKNMLTKRQAEKTALEQELREVQAKIQARLNQINKENEARQRAFPTSLHLAKPDKCDYYHCHGMLCGKPDPAGDECGHGSTVQTDVDCKQFFNAYLQAAGVN